VGDKTKEEEKAQFTAELIPLIIKLEGSYCKQLLHLEWGCRSNDNTSPVEVVLDSVSCPESEEETEGEPMTVALLQVHSPAPSHTHMRAHTHTCTHTKQNKNKTPKNKHIK